VFLIDESSLPFGDWAATMSVVRGTTPGRTQTETNPRDLRSVMSIRYKVLRQNKPNEAILHAVNWIQPKSGRFATKINAHHHQGLQLSYVLSIGYS
jgi:hypothetical protein